MNRSPLGCGRSATWSRTIVPFAPPGWTVHEISPGEERWKKSHAAVALGHSLRWLIGASAWVFLSDSTVASEPSWLPQTTTSSGSREFQFARPWLACGYEDRARRRAAGRSVSDGEVDARIASSDPVPLSELYEKGDRAPPVALNASRRGSASRGPCVGDARWGGRREERSPFPRARLVIAVVAGARGEGEGGAGDRSRSSTPLRRRRAREAGRRQPLGRFLAVAPLAGTAPSAASRKRLHGDDCRRSGAVDHCAAARRTSSGLWVCFF